MSNTSIFLKNPDTKKNSGPNDKSIQNSDELSDELNNLIGTNKNIKNNKKNPKPKNSNEEFDIGIMYQDIWGCLSQYKESKITAEIISFKISGENAWVDIKCKDYQISGIFWKISLNKNYHEYKLLKSGDQIIFTGNFSIMKKNLNIYFNIKQMEKFGKGDYLDLYDGYRLKIKELGMGVNKKKLSNFPYTIGIITAIEGAAIQDILQTLKQDNFIGRIIIKNSIVQGSQCPKSLINSIEWFESNYSNSIDLLMVTRGGGGWEDLVGFSDWNLLIKLSTVRFITLSAVGHQIDNQLTDEVCDYKFATPSIGAKFIVETQKKYIEIFKQYQIILSNLINKYNQTKTNFVNLNYSNIIKKYEHKDLLFKVRNMKNNLSILLNKYYQVKNNFYSKLSKLKPTIIRKSELTSITDFIDPISNKEISPKKIEIYFIDGRIKISYKILEYEQF